MKEQRQAGVSPGEAHQEGQSPVERTPEEKPRVIKGRFPWYSGQKEEASRQTHHRLCHEADSRGKGSARLPPGAGGSLSEGGGQAGPCPPGGRWRMGPGQRWREHRWAPPRLSSAADQEKRSGEHLTIAHRAGDTDRSQARGHRTGRGSSFQRRCIPE